MPIPASAQVVAAWHLPPQAMDTNATPPSPPAGTVDLSDDNNRSRWALYFGVTPEQIEEAVKAAGTDPKAVQEHLLNQGSSAGAG